MNRLKLNPSKTEFVLFGSQQMLSLSSCSVNSFLCIKYLGCYLDEHLNFKKFVSEKYKTLSLNLYLIKHYLTDSCKQMVQFLATSHLDYINRVLYGFQKCTIKRLQLLLNRAAKLV